MPTAEWMKKYNAMKEKLVCKFDIDKYYTESTIGNMKVDVLDIGKVYFPTGKIFACDPLIELEDSLPFIQTIPVGTYPIKICVVPSDEYVIHHACAKLEILVKSLFDMRWEW